MKLHVTLNLPEPLYRELLNNCRESSCHPRVFAAEAVEATLAARRLPRVEAGPLGPWFGRATSGAVESRTAKALGPLEIPTVSDLDILDEIE